MTTMTLPARLADRERQRFFVAYLAGKMIGLIVAFGAMFVLTPWIVGRSRTHAQDDLQTRSRVSSTA